MQVDLASFELAASCLQGRRSPELSYRPLVAGPGTAPGSRAYEARVVLFHQPALGGDKG